MDDGASVDLVAGSIDLAVGAQVRMLRRQQNLSLQQVAQRSDLSVGYLSQIERGLSSPSVRDLVRLAAVLRTDLSFFFAGRTDATPVLSDDIVVRVGERREVVFGSRVTKQLLTPPDATALRLYMITLEERGHSGESSYSHAGEEAGLVLQGRLLLTVDGRSHMLNEGDAFRFESERPHSFSNAAAMVTRVIWVNVVA